MIHREQITAVVTEALTRWTWPTAEAAAQAAAEVVMARLAEEPGLEVISDAAGHVIGVTVAYPQAGPQQTPPEDGSDTEAVVSGAADPVPADPSDGLPHFTDAIYTPTPGEVMSEEHEFKPGEIVSRFRPLPPLADGLGMD